MPILDYCTLTAVTVPLRRIIHIDMDAFYASVEQRDQPDLRGRPVAVGGDPQGRGVVAAASYEARRFGVHSAMSMAKAVRLCPSLVIVQPDFTKYRNVSRTVFELFQEVTPLVEPLSLDEAYLDVTENLWGEPLASRVARRLKESIREKVSLTASAGVAPNKFLAKTASGWRKPDGLTVVPPDRIEPFLQQLSVDALWGVGPVTARRLKTRGIERLVDVRTTPLEVLRELVGSQAEWLQRLAKGIDERQVDPNRETKSSGTENTYATDLKSLDEIREEVTRMAADVAKWLERRLLFARTVTLKMRYSDFTTITRSNTQVPATRDAALLTARAVALIDRTDAGHRPVRLLGVSVHNLCEDPSAQGQSRAGTPWLPIFSDERSGVEPSSEEPAWDRFPEAES